MPDYSKLTVVKLKDELKQRNLGQTGLKAALVARLEEHDAWLSRDGADDVAEPTEPPLVAKTVEPVQEAGLSNETMAANSNAIDTRDEQHPEAVEETADEPGKVVPAQEVDSEEFDTAPQAAAVTIPGVVPAATVTQQTPLPPAEVSIDSKPQPPTTMDSTADGGTIEPATTPTTLEDASQQLAPSKEADSVPQALDPNPQTTINAQELAEDTRKRKRRSKSPVLTELEGAIKRAKAEDGSPRVRLPEDIEDDESKRDMAMGDASCQTVDANGHIGPDATHGKEERDVVDEVKDGAPTKPTTDTVMNDVETASQKTSPGNEKPESTSIMEPPNLQSPLLTHADPCH